MATTTGYIRGGTQLGNFRSLNAGYVPPAVVHPVVPPQPVIQPPPLHNITDDYERWYTEATPSNRMLLALRSGIDEEVGWSLDRLCRLCHNEQFMLSVIPGLSDALFEWPEVFLKEAAEVPRPHLFSLSPSEDRKQRHALESLFILRNAAIINDVNSNELAAHRRTRLLITKALTTLKPDTDINTEFLIHCVELLQAIAKSYTLPPPSEDSTIVNSLEHLACTSTNRSIIIASFIALHLLMENHANLQHLTASSLALNGAIRYLPLFNDKPLMDSSLNYLFTHLSVPSLAKAFLLHPDMPATLRLLVSYIVSEQVEETATLDVTGPTHTGPAGRVTTVNVELVGAELQALAAKPEPERCYEWMKTIFEAVSDSEVTQVEFWNMYKDTFQPFAAQYPLLVASDVIKNVNTVFPQAQAMVIPGPPQRFVVRGVARRRREVTEERFQCRWDNGKCTSAAFDGPENLFKHVSEHINDSIPDAESGEWGCSWNGCDFTSASQGYLYKHIVTHMPTKSAVHKNSAQPSRITLSSLSEPNPHPNPTERSLPPAPRTFIRYQTPAAEPPSAALTALLIIRTLFRASFASSDAAPKADADHFGFPGLPDEQDEHANDPEEEQATALGECAEESESRGRKAFTGVRWLMEQVRIKDQTLMSWIREMLDAGLTGTH